LDHDIKAEQLPIGWLDPLLSEGILATAIHIAAQKID
jgi:hypothetical protein